MTSTERKAALKAMPRLKPWWYVIIGLTVFSIIMTVYIVARTYNVGSSSSEFSLGASNMLFTLLAMFAAVPVILQLIALWAVAQLKGWSTVLLWIVVVLYLVFFAVNPYGFIMSLASAIIMTAVFGKLKNHPTVSPPSAK